MWLYSPLLGFVKPPSSVSGVSVVERTVLGDVEGGLLVVRRYCVFGAEGGVTVVV